VVNNVILICSFIQRAYSDVAKISLTLGATGIDVDVGHDCVFNAPTIAGEGIRLERVRCGLWGVTDEWMPRGLGGT
jgi:hypothetical protein